MAIQIGSHVETSGSAEGATRPETPAPSSRRALLAAALGSIAGAVATALGRPVETRAAAGDPLILGQQNFAGNSATRLSATSSGGAFWMTQNGSGSGVRGESINGTGGVFETRHPDRQGLLAQNVAPGTGTGAALKAVGGQNNAIVATTTNPDGRAIMGQVDSTGLGISFGVWGQSETSGGHGVIGVGRIGVTGECTTSAFGAGYGLEGLAVPGTGLTYGVYGQSNSPSGFGGYFVNASADGIGLYAAGAGTAKEKAVLQVHNTKTGNTSGAMSAYITNDSNFATAHFQNDGNGQVLWLINGGTDAAGANGGDFIHCRNNDGGDIQFRVATDGSAYSDGTFNPGGADFAELLPAEAGLEPGDVLAIGPDGRLRRTRSAHQRSVAGVYSTKPGILGGLGARGTADGKVPLAIAGIVPVKASAENGPIAPGDLLASASTAGHAMRANGEARLGCVIGKALEPLPAARGTIEMLVILQ